MSFFKNLGKAVLESTMDNLAKNEKYEAGTGQNPYTSGRPKRYYPITKKGNVPPKLPGEYRINGSSGYIGESNDLHRRMTEHVQKGKILKDDDYFDYMVAVDGSSGDDRRKHESEKIKTKKPSENKRGGGGGRKSD